MNHYSRTTGKVPRLGAIIAASAALMILVGPTASAATQTNVPTSGVVVGAPGAPSSPPIAVGGNHACALPGDGTVKCWGYNYAGELGDGTKTDPHAPAGDSFPLVPVTVIAGPDSTSALTGVSAITAGYEHTCALLADGSVRCWGANSAAGDGRNGGQLGDGTTIDRPAPVTVVAGPGSSSALSGVTAIAAGDLYTCALLADATVKCWGDAPQGSSTAPVTVVVEPGSSTPLSGVTAIAAGDYHTCALLSGGTVTCWGSNDAGELGNDSTTNSTAPVTVVEAVGSTTPLSDVTAITAEHGVLLEQGAISFGYPHTCALLADSSVKCWGSNAVGQLGDGTSGGPQGHSAAPVSVLAALGSTSTLTGVSAIAAGNEHTCALLVAGTVKCWGLSWGLNPSADNAVIVAPLDVVAATGSSSPLSGVTAIAAGDGQTCATLLDGSVTCWSGSPEIVVAILGLLVTAPAATPEPTATSQPTTTPTPAGPGADSLAGDWSVTYGSLSVVTISGSNGSYTVTAKSPVRVIGSACDLPPGTLIATFSGSGGSYSGQHGLWHPSDCSFANWASVTLRLDGNSLTAVLADGERAVFTRIGPAQATPTAPPSFGESVATPAEITLDPVIIAQGIAIVAGFVILIPFPSTLFNSTLEANYDEIVGKVRRGRRRLRRLFALPGSGARRGLPHPPTTSASEPRPAVESRPDAATDSQPAQSTDGRFWKTPLGIVLFLLLSALLIGFLDPTFGLDLVSLATFAGLAAGLVVTLLAFDFPIALAYRRVAVPFSVRALPGTLAVGLVCVLVTRLTDFHPGYIYGLVVALIAARELSVAVQGKVMMQATIGSIVVAVVAWFGLWWVDTLTPTRGDPGLALVAVQTALAMAVAAGVELTVFGMVPVRFLAGESIYRWNRRVWAVLFAVGMLGFTIILMNPRGGYLADATRTPLLTIVVLLLGFGLGSVMFWGYFRFRRAPATPSAAP